MAQGETTGHVRTPVSLLLVGLLAAMAILHFGAAVFEPLAFALFIIALTAPFMARLRPRIGKGLAMVVTVIVTMLVLFLFLSTIVWGVGQVAQWVLANLPRFEAVYRELDAGMAARNMPLEALVPARFDPRWIIGPVTGLLEQARLVSGFALLMFVFVVLGLSEIDGMSRRLQGIEATRPDLHISHVCRDVSTKFGLYMKVRLVISVVDAIICYLFFRLIGLEEPLAWAILVGTLNFIPFIGPLIVAVFLGVFAAAQFGSLWMVFAAVAGTTAINFVLGSYIEPIMAGSALSMSPVLVLFSVFFWAVIWGIPGAFIGVQIMIVSLAILRVMPSASWIAELFSGEAAPKPQKAPTH